MYIIIILQRAGRSPENAARLQEAERQARLNRRRAEEAETEARELKHSGLLQGMKLNSPMKSWVEVGGGQ